MPGGSAKPLFVGPQKLATVDDLDAFVRRALADESFVYCEALDLIRGETSMRVTELSQEGLVRPHRERRPGGGWLFYVVRTRYRPSPKSDPVQLALADPATDIIYREFKREAIAGLPCSSDAALARKTGLTVRQQAAQKVRKLVAAGLIKSEIAYEGGVRTRVVTILKSRYSGAAAGRFTALPKKWAALIAAANADAASAR